MPYPMPDLVPLALATVPQHGAHVFLCSDTGPLFAFSGHLNADGTASTASDDTHDLDNLAAGAVDFSAEDARPLADILLAALDLADAYEAEHGERPLNVPRDYAATLDGEPVTLRALLAVAAGPDVTDAGDLEKLWTVGPDDSATLGDGRARFALVRLT